MHILAVEPYFGGSHRAFLQGAQRHSRHQWTLVTGPARHWKWRMRVAPLTLAQDACTVVSEVGRPDLILCSDMLDLPAWLGVVARISQHSSHWTDVPIVTYFHENQWTYPQSPQARVDFHFGYTNLLTALSSTACIFNSRYHLESFLAASEQFVKRMPDSQTQHDFDTLQTRCQVIPPGFDPPADLEISNAGNRGPCNLGWVSRWEYDKRPDRFLQLLQQLDERGVDFVLTLLGARQGETSELNAIGAQFGDRIVHDGFAESASEYWRRLTDMDMVVSTADHEFFGIAVCEAIWAGAIPVVPNRLSYPELVPGDCLYESLDEAIALVISLSDADRHQVLRRSARELMAPLRMEQTVRRLDDALADIS